VAQCGSDLFGKAPLSSQFVGGFTLPPLAESESGPEMNVSVRFLDPFEEGLEEFGVVRRRVASFD
jgi:hypothetical protein